MNGAIRIREQDIDAQTFSTSLVAVRRKESNSFNFDCVALIRKPLIGPALQIDRLLARAQKSTPIREQLIGLSSSNGFWVKAMNTINTIEHHFPDMIKQLKTDSTYADRHSRMIATANNFAHLSANARQGQLGHKIVSKPISPAEAKEHINSLLQAALRSE